MIICNCNALTESHVKAAVDAGARRWSGVHAYHGCEVQCGSCGVEITDCIAARRKETSALQDASAFFAAAVFSEA
jgi:bacterioferritin-associated ferredoxin